METSQKETEPKVNKWYAKPGKTESFKNFKLKAKATTLDFLEFKQQQQWFWAGGFDRSIPETEED